MPDWSYGPVLRPMLFRLPAARARDFTLSAMGALAALPFGPGVIDFLGHMAPPGGIRTTVWDIPFPSPLGLGAGLDIGGTAARALARFGFGYLELGPVALERVAPGAGVERLVPEGAIRYWEPAQACGVEDVARRLERAGPLRVPVGVRLAHRPGIGAAPAGVERRLMVERLGRLAAFFTLETRGGTVEWEPESWRQHVAVVAGAVGPKAPLLLCVAPDLAPKVVDRLLEPALAAGVRGVLVGGGLAAVGGTVLTGAPAFEPSLAMVQRVRRQWGPDLGIIGAGGIAEPAGALQMLAAGADLVQVNTGLVYSGPGLPKRINEAVAHVRAVRAVSVAGVPAGRAGSGAGDGRAPAEPVDGGTAGARDEAAPAATPVRRAAGWVWSLLLGAGMVLGGVLAWLVAATRVMLPYDEQFLGMTREAVAVFSPRLLLFMMHDRISLAGTMIAIGVMYCGLAVGPLRQGAHWARTAFAASGALGFASFFLFPGFGYFDPVHALVTVLLFPFYVLAVWARPEPALDPVPPNLRNSRRWRSGTWGQLLLVVVGFGLTGAGMAISSIGVTRVFVPEDLEFLQTTAAALDAVNPRLVPVVAHDRAGFGGALVSCGLAVLLPVLWGFRQGARWLWWALLGAGTPGFATALGVHFAAGYVDAWHLAPAVAGALIYALGMAFSYPYLMLRETGWE